MTQQRFSELLADYLGGELHPAHAAEFEAALQSNPAWAARVNALRSTHNALTVLPRDFDPTAVCAPGMPHLATALAESRAAARPSPRAFQLNYWTAALVCAALVTLAFALGFRIGRSRAPQLPLSPPAQRTAPQVAAAPQDTLRLASRYARVGNAYPTASAFTRALLTIANR